MDQDLKNLANLPWASVPELAEFRGVNRTTVSRKEAQWKQGGLVVAKHGGRLVRPRDRLLITTAGLSQVFTQHHAAPGLHCDYHKHGYHEHDPLHPERADHQHPGFFNGYSGALHLWEKLDRIETWYPAALEVLLRDVTDWTHDGKPRRILSWRWLRNARFVEAVATYEDNYRIFFCHIGLSVTEKMLEYRWTNRFPDVHDARLDKLVTRSRGQWMERRRDPLIDPPDPDLDCNPKPSAYVISTPDFRGVELALRVLPSDVGYLYLVGPPPFDKPDKRLRVGRAYPAPHDNVADAFEIPNFGGRLPQDLCPAE